MTSGEFRPKKSLGQHFLVSQKVLWDFLTAAELSKDDLVIEIGAGLGIITRELAEKVKKVIAVEIDSRLCNVLSENLGKKGLTNLQIVNQDFLNFHFNDIYHYSRESERNKRIENFKIVGSIPYQITSPLLHKLLFSKIKPSLVVLIIQKEVAQKITARPPKASYLSNLVQCFGEATIVGKPINPAAFWPPPKVQSAILKIKTQNSLSDLKDVNMEEFCQFLHRGFSHPRKMLKKIFPEAILIRADISPTLRAGNLTLTQWQKLFRGVTPVGVTPLNKHESRSPW